MAVLADLDRALVAELPVLLDRERPAVAAEAVAAPHAIVNLLRALVPVVLVQVLERAAALDILAGEGQVLRDELLGPLVDLRSILLRQYLISALHILVVILDLDLLLLGELPPVVQNEQLLRLILRNILDERRLPVHFFDVFELQGRF